MARSQPSRNQPRMPRPAPSQLGSSSATDIGITSPCCQGHKKARGKKNGNPKHYTSRSKAWAVPSAAEVLEQDAWVVENVPEFVNWVLYPCWVDAMRRLGYWVAPHVDCADLGVPQQQVRLFLICTKSKAPIQLQLQQCQHVPAARASATASPCLTTAKAPAPPAAISTGQSAPSQPWTAGPWSTATACGCSAPARPWPPYHSRPTPFAQTNTG
ncbi:DNA cytosine methyltransferase [Pseudomonas sp. S32]|nr:DNA cytosine methyltransferase [Pseudomonas sp. S32]